MRRWAVTIAGCGLVLASFASAAGAASESTVVPGATYAGKGTKLTVDASGAHVSVLALPVHAQCKGDAPSNEGDYGPSGLGPFSIEDDGSFTNIAEGTEPGPTQSVIRGKFDGTTVTGTVVEPAFTDKGFDCKRFSGRWTARRVAGTGDTTKPGARYASDDFSKRTSGFDVFNEDASYAEYLRDSRFRIGTRRPTGAASLRKAPTTTSADVTLTTGYTSGTAGDGVGVACAGTDATTFLAGYVTVDGYAYLVRYAAGDPVESAPPQDVPAGLLRTGPQAQNEVRLVCTPSPNAGRTNLHLFLNGQEVANAEASTPAAGKVGLFVASTSGTTEFTFSKFAVSKPRA